MTQPTSASAHEAGPQPCAELTQLGERLRQAREQQQLSVDVLAARLRLGSDQLLALENADPGRLPEPVFVIAQAKRVAASLDLDLQPEITALRGSAWMARQGRPNRPALITPSPARPMRPDPIPGRRSARPGWSRPLGLAALAVALLAALGLALALAQNRLRLQARPTAAPRPLPAARPAVASSAATRSSPQQPASQAGAGLRLSVQGSSWVAVRRDDGSTLYQGTLQGSRVFPLGRGLEVLAGRPDLVSAAIDGQPPRPMGPIDAVQWRRFGPAAPLSVSQTPSPSQAPQSQSRSQRPKVATPNRTVAAPTDR